MSSTILSMISSTLLGLEPLLGSSKLVGREVAIRWNNRKRDGAVWACATQMNQCTEFEVASDDDSDVR